MKKTFLAFTCIVVFTLGILLVSCEKKETTETTKETPAATEQSDKGEEEKPKVGGY